MLEAVAEKENIEITDEDIEEEIKTMADNYGMPVDSMKSLVTDNERKAITTDLKVRRAVDLIIENSKEDKSKKVKAEDDDVIEKKKVAKKSKSASKKDKEAEE